VRGITGHDTGGDRDHGVERVIYENEEWWGRIAEPPQIEMVDVLAGELLD
jgi:hypothetical protein